MPVDIIVPPLSQTSDTLVFIGWFKQVGDLVLKGEALFEVETDKATLEVESPATGTIHEVLAEPGSEVAIKSRIGSIAVAEAQAVTLASPPESQVSNQAEAGSADSNNTLHRPPTDRILVSPRARRLADKEGVPLSALKATGPRGLIVERDVRAHLAELAGASSPVESLVAEPPRPSSPDQGRRLPLTATRRTIARRLQAAQPTTVPVTLTRDVDATELVALRERLLLDGAGQSVRPTYTDLLIHIVARCLQRHPTLNGSFDGEQLEIFEDAVHMGLAVDTDRGLLVPVLRHVEHKGLMALARERAAVVQQARDGKLRPEALTGGTFTLTNLGALGIDAFTPLLNPPQIAILGLGRIRPVAGPLGDAIGLRQAMFLSLTFDHRAVDGAPAARLLVDIAGLVERPDRIWL